MNSLSSLKNCFLITCSNGIRKGRYELYIWGISESGRRINILINNYRPFFFIPSDTPEEYTEGCYHRSSGVLKDFSNRDSDALYFTTPLERTRKADSLKKKGIACYEEDIEPLQHYLIEKGIKSGFTVRGEYSLKEKALIFTNPEISGSTHYHGFEQCVIRVYQDKKGVIKHITLFHKRPELITLKPELKEEGTLCRSEKELLLRFTESIKESDPVIITGWNLYSEALPALKERAQKNSVSLDLSTARYTAIPDATTMKRQGPEIPGRIAIDTNLMLNRNISGKRFDSPEEALEKLKLSDNRSSEGLKYKTGNRRWVRDITAEKGLIKESGLIDTLLKKYSLSGQHPQRSNDSIGAFDRIYLPRLHAKGYTAPCPDDPETSHLKGGYVMESVPGFHRDVLVFDFKSLYPTIIMSFMIDPLGRIAYDRERIETPSGLSFSKNKTILPYILRDLMNERKDAAEAGNLPLSLAVKLIMNSFYGVLGSRNCRFFSVETAGAITSAGRWILRETSKYLKDTYGYDPIYGDTDSIFIKIGHEEGRNSRSIGTIGKGIAKETTEWLSNLLQERFSTESELELEFERHFLHFFMPSIRGSNTGSKKRYCGAYMEEGDLKLEFKGLESARTDWTDLASEFQGRLLRTAFRNQDLREVVLDTLKRLKNGEEDQNLIYRKTLRKDISEYGTYLPPHVRAAAQSGTEPGEVVSYIITEKGPEPADRACSSPDYSHYIETQLRPVADSILEWFSLDFDSIVSGQQNLFDT